MSVAVITGSGTHALPGFALAETLSVETPFGCAAVSRGELAGAPILHVSRHGEGHARLSNHVEHRATVWALAELGARVVIGATACGAVDPGLALGSLVVFDDLHFPSNRLPDGALCTVHTAPGGRLRGHLVLHGGPYSEGVRGALLAGAHGASLEVRDGGVYGHVDGPRFNTPSEIAALAACGVVAVSQTGGPETVLCGELELAYGLVGFVTDYANGVRPDEPTPVATLTRLMGESRAAFAQTLARAVPRLAETGAAPAGTMLRLAAG